MVQPLSGGPARRLTAYLDTTVMWVAWYPDGQALLFQVDPNGTEHYQLYRSALTVGNRSRWQPTLTPTPSTS